MKLNEIDQKPNEKINKLIIKSHGHNEGMVTGDDGNFFIPLIDESGNKSIHIGETDVLPILLNNCNYSVV
jgi:hypothetical protein